MTAEEVRDFVNKHKQDFNERNYDKIYEHIGDSYEEPGYLTDILRMSGINPLKYMNKVPDYYMEGSNFEGNFNIDSDIKFIGLLAFNRCRHLNGIVIPDSVKKIGTFAFHHCPELSDVYFKGTKQ